MGTIPKDLKDVVLAKLSNMPSHMKLALGNASAMTRDEIIKHVKDEDEIGKKFVEMEMLYLKNIVKQYR